MDHGCRGTGESAGGVAHGRIHRILHGTSQVLKTGTKSKPIRLVEGDHQIDCRMDGLSIALKAMYVKKVNQ
ncbi:MAG: hypothetical protein EOP83_35330 [Verrucomicrobiaceae bacterium]|nr:MAG: hypothetical protein EOP83_35330 [Verrucomicrobiaceae bacterium]